MSRYSKATVCQRYQRFPDVAAYSPERASGPESSKLQNFLIRQHRFPTDLRRGEHVAEFWSHLASPEECETMFNFEESTDRLREGAFLMAASTDRSFLAMCQKLVNRKFKATGGLAARFTQPVSGRSLLRITIVGIYADDRILYSDNEGPHILSPGQEKYAFEGHFLGHAHHIGFIANPAPGRTHSRNFEQEIVEIAERLGIMAAKPEESGRELDFEISSVAG